MVPRRRKRELLFEVLGGKAPAAGNGPHGDRSGFEAATGAVVAVALLVALALGGYYWSSREDRQDSGAPALSAERRVGDGTSAREVPPPPVRGAESGASPESSAAASEAGSHAILVRTIRWDKEKGSRERARDEAVRLVQWLKNTAKLPAARAVQIPPKNGNGYEVYVGSADSSKELDKLLKAVRKLEYAGRVYYFQDAIITNRPQDVVAARNSK